MKTLRTKLKSLSKAEFLALMEEVGLSDDENKVLKASILHNLTYDQIVYKHNISISTVKRRSLLAMKKILKYLEYKKHYFMM